MRRLILGLAIGILLAPTVAHAQSDVVVYYHTDAIGSVRMISDATGAVVARYDYLPFGRLLGSADNARTSAGCYPNLSQTLSSRLPPLRRQPPAPCRVRTRSCWPMRASCCSRC